MAQETTSATTMIHTDDPNVPTEVDGYNVADLTLATSGFVKVFSVIATTMGADMAVSAMLSAVVSVGPHVLDETDLARVLREAADKLPAVYAHNEERNRQAAEQNRAELDKLN